MSTAASPLPIEGFDSCFAEVSGVWLHYWIGGDPEGQPVVLWHGFLSTGYAWRDVAPALAAARWCTRLTTWAHYPRCSGQPTIRTR